MVFSSYTTINGRYQLVKKVGRGSFGEVWLAEDTLTKTQVAIKLYIALDDKGLQEFSSEYITTYSLNHPNLLHATYYDIYENMPFLVMPFCPGSSENLIGNTDEKEVWRFIRDTAAGLEYLHSKDIIHRDIKPDNILRNTQGDYLITDFGVSLKMRSTLRRNSKRENGEGDASGTLPYMGPEMFSSQPNSVKATDIWALGATIFEIITGELPYCGQGGVMILHGADAPIVTGEWSQNLKAMIQACLSKETWERPTAEKIKTFANAVLSGKDVSIIRGDVIKFADVQFDWSSIPAYKLASDVVEVRGIGTHYMNTCYAEKESGWKRYLEDHSKNGTSINGSKVAPNSDTLLKKSDVISCAGENVPNPYGSKQKGNGGRDTNFKPIWYTLACVVLCALVGAGIYWYYRIREWSPKEINETYRSSVCMILMQYEVKLSLDGRSKSLSGQGEATGFFVSKDGKVVTNHHVTAPWDVPEKAAKIQEAKQELINYRNTVNSLKTMNEASYSKYVSVQDYGEIEEEKSIDIYVIPNGKIYNWANAIEATNIKSSSSMDVDLGYFQLVTYKLPDGVDFIPAKRISKTHNVKVGECVTAIGFPSGSAYLKDIANKEIQTTTTSGSVIRVEDDITFNFDASITGGSSGSPMFNSHGELVGVASDGYAFSGGNYNGGVHAYLIRKLMAKDIEL